MLLTTDACVVCWTQVYRCCLGLVHVYYDYGHMTHKTTYHAVALMRTVTGR